MPFDQIRQAQRTQPQPAAGLLVSTGTAPRLRSLHDRRLANLMADLALG